jgi:hypothetical protein
MGQFGEDEGGEMGEGLSWMEEEGDLIWRCSGEG